MGSLLSNYTAANSDVTSFRNFNMLGRNDPGQNSHGNCAYDGNANGDVTCGDFTIFNLFDACNGLADDCSKHACMMEMNFVGNYFTFFISQLLNGQFSIVSEEFSHNNGFDAGTCDPSAPAN